MKRIIFRSIAQVLFLMMVLITAACSQTTAPNATTSATATSAAATPEATSTDSPTAAPEVDPFGKYDAPITVKVVRILDSTTKFDKSNPDTESLESNVWSKAYEEMLGIKLEYLWTPSGDQYDTKWTTAIASNDLPDMAAVDATVYKSLVKGGLVQDMTDVFDKYASDYYKSKLKPTRISLSNS
jgi:putative aldouronate transport system substrate-binding protein